MKFTFVAHKCLPFHASSLEERAFGGTETAVIRLAAELSALGNDVKVFTHHDAPPPSIPHYFPISEFEKEREARIVISVRDWFPLFVGVPAQRRFFWTGDSYDQLQNFGIGDRRVAAGIDGLFAVSAWHASTLCGRSGFPLEKAWVLRNGVHLPHFEGQEARGRKRLIYSSTPYRGLMLVPQLFEALRQRHPDAELHVFSGYDVYSGPTNSVQQQEWDRLRAVLEKVPGCVVHGNVTQKELAREFMRSSVLFYPNIFEETSCITVMEAQAAGCAVVTSDRGALKETVGLSGFVIPGRPGSPEYSQQFLGAVDSLLTDDKKFEECSRQGIERAATTHNWAAIASKLDRYLREVHQLS